MHDSVPQLLPVFACDLCLPVAVPPHLAWLTRGHFAAEQGHPRRRLRASTKKLIRSRKGFFANSENADSNSAEQEWRRMVREERRAGGVSSISDMTGGAAASEARSAGELHVLATTDLHCNLLSHDYYANRPDPAIGLSRVATLISQARAAGCGKAEAACILVDNGDGLQGAPLGDVLPQNVRSASAGACIPGSGI